MAILLLTLSREQISLRCAMPFRTVLLGLAVFVLWVAPDYFWPEWRNHWLFRNPIVGDTTTSIPDHLRTDTIAIVFRSLRAVVIVPIVEELFWRAWLMRWLIGPDFRAVPLGAYTRYSFAVTAVLFAVEHGSYWDVGLMAGIAYNWWMLRTRSLGDCIFAHAVTNAALCAYVLACGKWEYW
jgi:CAAX prenyl protease-like protein